MDKRYITNELIRQCAVISGRNPSLLELLIAKFNLRYRWAYEEILNALVAANERVYFDKIYRNLPWWLNEGA